MEALHAEAVKAFAGGSKAAADFLEAYTARDRQWPECDRAGSPSRRHLRCERALEKGAASFLELAGRFCVNPATSRASGRLRSW